MSDRFKKNKNTGFVHNSGGDLDKYKQKREAIKKMVRTNQELNMTKNQMSTLESEVKQLKELVDTLIKDRA